MHGSAVLPLFPLPLAPFEAYMLADDRPGYPMTFVMCLRLSGQLDRAAWDAALATVLPRHPLLCARLRPVRGKGLCWMPAEESTPWCDWGPAGADLICPGGEEIDLRQQAGLRIWVRQGEQTVELTTQFHHACCDGIGALRFLGEVFAVYAAQTGAADSPALVPLAPERLVQRGHCAVPPPEPVSRGRALSTMVRETWRMLARRPVPLAAPGARTADGVQAGPFPHIHCQTLDAAAHRQLREWAKQQGATLNDLLMAALFQTLEQWNVAGGAGRRQDWIRITMPTDLRTRADEQMPAANVMSYAFLTRRAGDCRSPVELLTGIRDETRAIRYWRLGTLFLEGVRRARAVPGLLQVAIGGQRCHATAVLSNLGDPSRRFSVRFPRRDERVVLGNLVLQRLTAAPPLRPQTRAVFVITTYAGELTISVRCDPRLFSAGDARALLSQYVRRLELASALSPPAAET